MGRITLYGFYQYDKNILDEIILPEGMDREMLIAEIIKNSGELYPYHQQPDMLKLNVKNWFSRKLYDFSQMYKALTAEYSPIENYDRIETINRETTHSGSDTETTTLGSSTTSQHTGSDNETTTLGSSTTTNHSGSDTNETQVSAYNESNYTNRDKETQTYNSSVTNTGSGEDRKTQTHNTTITSAGSGSDTAKTDYGMIRNESENVHIHGNIGITTSQTMVSEEIKLRTRYDLYKVIADMFEHEFLIQVY